MTCPACGTPNEAGRKFCKACGSRLALACGTCGTANGPDARFCGECGSSLEAAAEPRSAGGTNPAAASATGAATAPGPASERRLVSVLFADLVGFTGLSEGRDPEETRELLTRYFDLARLVIGRYGGTIEKFIGDAVMAVWGAPVAHEDDAERAVRAALELVGAVPTLGEAVEARAGVLTGEAAVTLGAEGQGLVAGEMVNTCSRLQSIAPPGAVLVGEATRQAAAAAIAYEPLGEQRLKGLQQPVIAHRALRVVAELGGRNRAGVLEPPFVGREDELRLVKDLFHATARDRRARLVSVMGPAGIGKSRLAWEFSKYTDGLVEDTWWHSGRSPAYGDGITFWALGEMVRRRAGLVETDDEPTTRRAITATVDRWVPDETERRWVERALLALLGLGEPLPGGRDELFTAWRTLFERIAAAGTVVLVFEDLHWADTGTLDFIDHLLDWSRRLPIYILTLARPELLERRPDWGAGKRDFTSLSLEPLPEPAMRELLTSLVPGLPRKGVAAIVERASGFPLYAVETVRMLVAEGRLRLEEDAYVPVGDMGELKVPETLQALISARLDGLEPRERALLQDAAVLGQTFSERALAAVTGGDPPVLTELLAGLVRRELLVRETDPRSPERGQYAFTQALTREVAYATLARSERRTRHLAVARWLESAGDEELSGALAGQYLAAYRATGPGKEAEALAAQSRVALRAATERAASLGSNEQALGFLRQAIEIAADPVERLVLQERAGRVALDAARLDEARQLLETARAQHRDRGDGVGMARVATVLAQVLTDSARLPDAVPILEEALSSSSGREAEPDVVRAMTELSRAYANLRDPRALELVDRSLELAEALELTPVIVEGIINRGLVLAFGGRNQEAMALDRGVLPMAEAHGLTRSRLRALNNLSAGLGNEDPQAAVNGFLEGVDVARRLGDRAWLLNLQFGAGFSAVLHGDWTTAERISGEIESLELEPSYAVTAAELGAYIDAARGRSEQAEARLASVRVMRGQLDDPRVPVYELTVEAWVAAFAGRLEQAGLRARAAAEAALADLTRLPAAWACRTAIWLGRAGEARSSLRLHEELPERGRAVAAERKALLAGVLALEGDPVASLEAFGDAIHRYRELRTHLGLALCLVDMVAVLGPDAAGTIVPLEEARDVLVRLGSPPLLARFDAAVSAGAANRQPQRSATSV